MRPRDACERVKQMFVNEVFVSITTTPATVERYLTEPALLEQWRSPLIMLSPLEGDLMAPGSKHRMRLKTLGLSGAIYTVTERDSNHILLTMDGPWRGTDLWRWFADGPRTVLQNRVEFEVPNEALAVLVRGIGSPVAQLDMRLQMMRLQQIIEGRATQRQLTAG